MDRQVEPISDYDRGWTLGYRIGRGQMEKYKGQLETLDKQMRYYKDLSTMNRLSLIADILLALAFFAFCLQLAFR